MKLKVSFLLLSTIYVSISFAQGKFTHADTLRGTIGEGRQQWDVLYYDITVKPDFASKSLVGKNTIRYFDNGVKKMQVDLQVPMKIDSIIYHQKKLNYRREGNAFWVYVRDTAAMYKIKPGADSLTVYFSGKPRVAKMPPWDGGWIWKKDESGNPWMSVACQGLGASVWYPCKDIQSDEPNQGASLTIIAPDTLMAIGNGRLIATNNAAPGFKAYTWKVTNPINNYNIIPYIGKYVHFGEKYNGEKGQLDMDYWVLDYNVEKAKKQFAEVPKMMKAFEHWFGPYPFYEDSYKLVESPHLGMEHQSNVAYGNGYANGYLGRDLSGTGWGNKWDFIIVHESGHEWFGNNITSNDIADMWVHEGFTNYSETLFTDYYFGKEAGNEYLQGLREDIRNNKPIIGPYGVNTEGSGDMYNKGGNMLHMVRQILGDDKFREMLREMNKQYYHKTVTSREIESFMQSYTKQPLTQMFDQYLRTTNIPVFEYKIADNKIEYRFSNCIPGFCMPLKVNGQWLVPTEKWQSTDMPSGASKVEVDKNFYVQVSEK